MSGLPSRDNPKAGTGLVIWFKFTRIARLYLTNPGCLYNQWLIFDVKVDALAHGPKQGPVLFRAARRLPGYTDLMSSNLFSSIQKVSGEQCCRCQAFLVAVQACQRLLCKWLGDNCCHETQSAECKCRVTCACADSLPAALAARHINAGHRGSLLAWVQLWAPEVQML